VVEKFREEAEEAEAWAARTKSAAMRAGWLRIAREWRTLASADASRPGRWVFLIGKRSSPGGSMARL
jgi:hypothetical protein